MFGSKVKILSRLVHRPTTVMLREGKPHTFTDGDYTHTVQIVVDQWQEAGAWWEDEPPRHLYRVTTTHCYPYDLERVGNGWFIYRVWD